MSSPTRVFVGRTHELSELEAGLDDARAGRGGLFLLAGEAGIGKTRLADELARRAATSGFGVRWGRCWEVGGAPAYWPWIQVLRGLLRDAGRLALEDDTRATLARLLPELGGAPPLATSGDSSQERFQLFDAVATVLRDASETQPWLVILDDLHAADPSSLALLLFVARELRDSRICALGTYRDQEARLAPDRGEALARVAREAAYLPLQRFDRADVGALLEARGGKPVEDELVSAVVAATEGHPLFVEEVERALASRRPTSVTGKLGVPETVRAAIHERLALVDPRTREVLEVAAVLGREFVPATLASLLGVDTATVREDLRGAFASGFLVELEPGLVSFSHALVRDASYRALERVRRAELHARAAEILDREGAPDAALGEIANHLLEAVEIVGAERALDGAERAARRALSTFAFEDAAAVLEKALPIVGTKPGPDRAFGRMLVLLGEARVRAHVDPGDVCMRAAVIARELDDGELLARAALALGAEISIATVNARLVGLLSESLRMLPDTPSVLRARVAARLSGALQPAADPREPLALAREAIAMARSVADEDTLRMVLHGAGAALVDYAEPRERMEVDGELLRLSERAGDRPYAFRAALRLFFDHCELGDVEGADAALRSATTLAQHLKRPRYRWYVAMLNATRAARVGAFEEADRWERQARSEIGEADDPVLGLSISFHRFAKAFARYDESRSARPPAFPSAMAALPQAKMYENLWSAFLGARAGDTEKAKDHAARISIDDPAVYCEPMALYMLVDVHQTLGSLEAAKMLLGHLEEHRGKFVSWGIFGLAILGPYTGLVARLEALVGRWDDAVRDFEDALSQAKSTGARPALAELHFEYGRALLRRDADADRAEAKEQLALASEIARDVGMNGLTKRVESLVPGSAPGARSRPSESAVGAPVAFSFDQEGDVWLVRHGALAYRVKDSRGMQMLAKLVANPGAEMHALSLGGGGDPGDLGDAGEVLDAQATAAYRDRLEDLRDAEREAEEAGDFARLTKVRGEIDQLAQQLAEGIGLGGRARRAGSIAERARTNVQRRIKDAIQRIEKHDGELGRYLGWTVRTGAFCAFEPAKSGKTK